MSAAVLATLPATGLELRSRPVPVPEQADDVVLRVDSCGICGTDLHILRGESYRPDLPFTLGHEPVGVVVAAGANAEAWMGKRETITLFTGDGTCGACLAGDERLCVHLQSITGVLAVDGAYAEFFRAQARQLLEVPDSLTGPEVASLVDSGATAANSIRIALAADPAQVLVVGAGPIGFLAAELLQADAVAHQVVEPNELRRAKLAMLGHTVVASFDQVAGQSGVIVDCTGASEAMTPGIAALTPHGLYVLAGYARAAVANWNDGITAAVELGARRLNSELSGDPNTAFECRGAFLDSIGALLPRLDAEDLVLSIEPHPWDFLETTTEALALLDEVGSRRVRYLHCIPHTFYLGGTATEQIESARGRFDHIHLADSFRPQRTIINPPGLDHRIHQHFDIGDGEIDWLEVTVVLKAVGLATVQVFGWQERAGDSFRHNRERVEELFSDVSRVPR